MCSSRLRAISVALLVGVVGTAAAVSAVPAQAEGHGDTRINKAVANHGEAVVVGPSVATTYPIRLSISDSSSWPPTATTRRTRWRETGGLYVEVIANDDDYRFVDDLIRFPVLRQTMTTIRPAATTTVAKGHTLRFTGRLWHADWEHQRWVPFRGKDVELRFKRKGTSAYETVRTVTTSSRGHLSAKVVAHHPGSYRWRFRKNSRNAKSVSAPTPVTLTH